MFFLSLSLKLFSKLGHGQLSFGRRVRLEPAVVARGGPVAIGDDCCIRFGSVLMPAGGRISIGARTSINHYCVLHGGNGLDIGDDCLIAPRVSFFAANHVFGAPHILIRSQGISSKGGIRIGNDVWIGTGAIILDGVVIEDGVVVGAGSVVTKSVRSGHVVAGNPARVIGLRGHSTKRSGVPG